MKTGKTIKENFDFAFENHKKNNLKIAEETYKQILDIDPNHFQSTVLLGTLSAQKKNFDLAKKLLQKAIHINPNYAETHYNLGLVFNELNDFQKAISCYKKAIEINPNYPDAYNNFGNCLKELEDFDEAINCYEKAININPNYADAYNNLGVIFKKLAKDEKAINCYEKTIKLQPNHIGAYYNLGKAFGDLGEEAKAINCYKKAIEINPNYADAYNNLGTCYKVQGDFKNAILNYELAVKSKPENLSYFYPLSELKNEILDSNLKYNVEKIINNKECNNQNLAFGNFLLARFESKEKCYEKELDYLIKGHKYFFEFKKAKFNRQLRYWLDDLPQVSKSSDYNSFNIINDKIKPIFIVGVPRCGSTLVEKIIASGSKPIPIGEETSLLHKFIMKKHNLSNFKNEDFNKMVLEEYRQKSLIQEKNDYVFTDKSLENFFYIGLIKKTFPNAKVINCNRNVSSSIMSIMKNNLVEVPWAHDIKNIFKYFNIYHEIILHFDKIYPGFIYHLNYEKLVIEPEKESKKLMEFCNLPWDEKCLEFYKRKDLISKTASNIQIREAIYKNSAEKYLPYKFFLNQHGLKYSWYN